MTDGQGLVFALDQIGQLAEHQAKVISEQRETIQKLEIHIREMEKAQFPTEDSKKSK